MGPPPPAPTLSASVAKIPHRFTFTILLIGGGAGEAKNLGEGILKVSAVADFVHNGPLRVPVRCGPQNIDVAKDKFTAYYMCQPRVCRFFVESVIFVRF